MMLVGAIVLVGFVWVLGRTESVGGDVAGFRQSLVTDSAAYGEGDPVTVTFRVCRVRPWPTLASSGALTDVLHDWRIVDRSGQVVASTLYGGRTLDLRQVLWLPGQCRSRAVAWDQMRRDAGFSADADWDATDPRVRAASGEYVVEGWWQTARWDDPPRDQRTVVSRPFRLDP
jgi:hypothetical protein